MKQEDKELLLKDLCGRLPYGVKVKTILKEPYTLKGLFDTEYGGVMGCLLGKYVPNNVSPKTTNYPLGQFKPYLFPLSSMKEEQLNDFYAVIRPVIEESIGEYREWKEMQEGNPTGKERPITLKDIACDITAVNWMLERHFDIYGLIEKGLAVDATGLNIYKEDTE